MRKPEPLAVSFEKLIRFYPKDKIGEDRENTLDALELALEMNSLVDLIHKANNNALAASQGADVPELCEFLVSTVLDRNTVGGARSAARGGRW